MNWRLIENSEDLKETESLWNELTEERREIAVHSVFPWLYSWWESYLVFPKVFSGYFKLFVLIIQDEQRDSTGIAPLIVEQGDERKVIRFLGQGVSDYADFLVKGDRMSFFRNLVDVLEQIHPTAEVDLQQFPKHSLNYEPFKAVLDERGYSVQESIIEKCPYVSINGDWDNYYSSISKKHRYDISRCQRLLSEQGNLVFKRLNVVDDKHIDAFSHINIQRQHSLSRLSLYENPFKNDFVRRVTKRLNNLGMIDAGILFYRDQIISYIYGFHYRQTHYYWNISFLPEYASYSPGKILIYCMLIDSFEKGYKKFDFMRGDEDYKFVWARDYHLNLNIKFRIL